MASSNNNNNNNNDNDSNANPMRDSGPFWAFLQSLQSQRGAAPGEGVDNQPEPGHQFAGGFPFPPGGDFGAWGPRGPFGGGGHRGGWGRRGRWSGPSGGNRGSFFGQPWEENARDAPPQADYEDQDGSPDTAREGPDDSHAPPPPPPRPHPHHGPSGCFPHPPPPHHGPPRGGRGMSRGGRGHCGHGRGRGGYHRGPPPPYPGGFNIPPWMNSLQQHPFAQNIRQYLEQYAPQRSDEWEGEEDDVFTPPIDIFNRPTEWQVHVALPGAQKDDIGVNWDAEKSTLNIAGIVHRPGDEEFLQSLSSTSERKVGMFDRSVPLPPVDGEGKDEVDDEGISAKLEDGVLVVTVPKVEREWTEVRKVDIE
ncbi:hypothetical protein MKZ38_007339 [Zalerion maritima]|uniref:SHSP domain-containing protein n=1 Tax=Zalerion maritima TaxID=339359 RepID=A0AAD5RVZ9_9PEZI|nr:hypothetical protein MKZ38_007339 [Zalerion maritima]